MNFKFIKEFLESLKKEICQAIQDIYETGGFSRGASISFIALLPKCDSPQKLNDYKLISLIGTLYKIIAKVLSLWLRKVIHKIILEKQFAFIGDRNMLDGVLVVNEMVHEALSEYKPTLVLKIDYEKAYDSVSWDFHLYMMKRFDFNDNGECG